MNSVSSASVEKWENRAYIDHVCCWLVIENVRLDLELLVGLLEEGVRKGHWMMAEVARAGDIDVWWRRQLIWPLLKWTSPLKMALMIKGSWIGKRFDLDGFL